MDQVLQVLVVYVLVCWVCASVYIVRNIAEIERHFLESHSQGPFFVLGILFTVFMAPVTIPQVIYAIVRKVIQEIREIKV